MMQWQKNKIKCWVVSFVGIVLLIWGFFLAKSVDEQEVVVPTEETTIVTEIEEVPSYTMIDAIRIIDALKKEEVNSVYLLGKYGNMDINEALAQLCEDF